MYYPLSSCMIFLVLLSFPYASSKEELAWCETIQFQCGNITAGFPFWGGNRPDNCGGRESLELRCNDKNITSLNISNHEYNIFHINHTSSTLRLIRADLLGSLCFATFNSTTLPPEISEISPIYKSLTIFHHCNPNLHYVSSYTCPGRNVISVYQNPTYQRFCQDSFTVNVPTRYVPEEKELNMTHLESVLRNGFEVNLKIDETTCEECSPSTNEHYGRCSQPFRCGNQGSLLYPFWIPGRADCGHPDFKLDCSRGFAELTLSFVKFRILEANYVSRIIKLARLDYKDIICPSDPVNAPFTESVLSLAPNTEMLTIYYGCKNSSFLISYPSNTYVRELPCQGDKTAITNYYVTRNISSPLPDESSGYVFTYLGDYCKAYISIPASGSALKTLGLDNLYKTLEQGFDLQLNQDCSMCLESKGACGYSQTSRRFFCYCKDGSNGNDCSSKKKRDFGESYSQRGFGENYSQSFGLSSRSCFVPDLINIVSPFYPEERITTETTEPEGPYSTQTF